MTQLFHMSWLEALEGSCIQSCLYILHVPCLCPQFGTEDPRLLSTPQPEGREQDKQDKQDNFMATAVIMALHYSCLATLCQYNPIYVSTSLCMPPFPVLFRKYWLGIWDFAVLFSFVISHLWRNCSVHWVEMYFFWENKSRHVSGTKSLLEFVSFLVL